jgi:four helix bundle protein
MGKLVRGFEDLEVWQLGKQLVVLAYKLTESFPSSERYNLTGQIRRAAISVPGNIAEGYGRYHYLDKVKFYLNARGSLSETKSHLLIASELGFVREDFLKPSFELIALLSVKLNNLITATRKTQRGK